MLLYGNELINKIREEFDKATNRIWIVVPFIGEWETVKKIMGTKWISNQNLDFKIITDIRNKEYINAETIKQFLHKGEVKTLDGLHAKIYLIDNSVFITSANLTGTAFTKRYEICEYYEIDSTNKILEIFNDWWSKSKTVESSWQPPYKEKGKNIDNDAGNTDGLKVLWKLPENSIIIKNFNEYQNNILLYNHFKNLYAEIPPRIHPDFTIYQEVDAFLNFLFHEHGNKPTHDYLEKPFRELSDKQRVSEIKKYKSEYIIWVESNPDFDSYRLNRIKVIQEKLKAENIDKLTRNDLTDVVDVLHTMNSLKLNRYRFLNPDNNDLEKVKDAFKILLFGSGPIEERMEYCKSNLSFFGKSSIRELVGWFYPDKYPIMNRNSNAGLKFFGYDIETY